MNPAKRFSASMKRMRSIRAKSAKKLNRLADAPDSNAAHKHIESLRVLNNEFYIEMRNLEKEFNLIKPIGY